MTSKLSPTMKHHEQVFNNGSRRPRSQAIAIKPSPQGGGRHSGDLQDESNECAAERMYDDCTWAMYLRIVEYRQKHPRSVSYQTETRHQGSLNRLNTSEDMSTPRQEQVCEDSRVVYFEDAAEDEIFEMELWDIDS